MKEKNIYMGCGPDIKDGFIHVDIRDLKNVDIVCNAWELSKHLADVNHIYSRHMLEHLTNSEANRTLQDWFKSLKVGGSIEVIVPNMDFHAQQWLQAEWSEDTINERYSDATYSFAGFWGWQEECDPLKEDYNNSYWSVHKSGYNKKRMKFLLEKIGYENIKIEIKDEVHLVAIASKIL